MGDAEETSTGIGAVVVGDVSISNSDVRRRDGARRTARDDGGRPHIMHTEQRRRRRRRRSSAEGEEFSDLLRAGASSQ